MQYHASYEAIFDESVHPRCLILGINEKVGDPESHCYVIDYKQPLKTEYVIQILGHGLQPEDRTTFLRLHDISGGFCSREEDKLVSLNLKTPGHQHFSINITPTGAKFVTEKAIKEVVAALGGQIK